MDNFNLQGYIASGKLHANSKTLTEAKKQGYDDREDESLGARKGAEKVKKQSMKARRDDSYGKFGKRDAEKRGKNKINKEGVVKEEVDVLGNEFLQDIQDTMKMYYKMDVDMDDIKDWVNMYYIGYNSEYDDGPGDVDYEGNEFGSEDYESEKKELVFDTAEREDFYMHLNPEADSTFPNLDENTRTRDDDYIKIANPSKLEDAFETINSEYYRMGLEFDIIEPDTISISNASPANVSDIIRYIEQEGIQISDSSIKGLSMDENTRTDAEEEGYKDGFDDAKDDVKDALSKMKVSELKAKIKEQILAELSLSEADEDEEEVDVDIDVEDEVEVDAEADDIEIERKGVKAKVEVGLSPEEEIVQDSLKAAMDAAEALGSDKLADQIGNTITFFTRQFVVGDRTD